MKTWEKIYAWKQYITKFFSIETKVSISRKTLDTSRTHEEQSWLGIG
jgi:hypothetical protein